MEPIFESYSVPAVVALIFPRLCPWKGLKISGERIFTPWRSFCPNFPASILMSRRRFEYDMEMESPGVAPPRRSFSGSSTNRSCWPLGNQARPIS